MRNTLIFLSLLLFSCSDNLFNSNQTENNQLNRSSFVNDITLQSIFDASESRDGYSKSREYRELYLFI